MSHSRQTSGCSSPIQPAASSADAHAGGAARVQERLLGRLEGERGAELPGQRLEHALEREEVRRLAAAPPGLGHQRPDREAADPVRLVDRRRPLAGKVSRQGADGPNVDPGSTFRPVGEEAGRRGRTRRARRRSAPRARLRWATSSSEPSTVVRITDWSSESGLERTIAVGARIVRGDPQPLGLARVGEAPADDLVEAEVAQRVLGAAPQPLLAAQAADPASDRGQGARQVLVEAVDPADLLDQVDLAGDVVVAVGRAP